jgi:hypothetical protein
MICLAVLVFVSAFQKPNLETSKTFSQSLGEEYGLEIESGPWLPKINHLTIDVQGRERLGTTLTHPPNPLPSPSNRKALFRRVISFKDAWIQWTSFEYFLPQSFDLCGINVDNSDLQIAID